MKTQSRSLDAWKGLAIVAVVGIHACNDAMLFPTDSANYQVGLVLRAVFNYAVALFFAVSGFLAPTREEIDQQGYVAYLQQKLARLWIPYVLWTLLYVALFKTYALLSVPALAKHLLLGTGMGIGYFVVVLSCLVVLHPLFARLSRAGALLVALLLTVATLLVMYWLRLRHPDAQFIRFPYSGLPFTLWIVFYYLGFAVRGGLLSMSRPKLLTLVAIGFVLSLAESVGVSYYLVNGSFAPSQAKFSTFAYAAAVSLLALSGSAGTRQRSNALVWMGQRSYVLYLSHLLFLMVAVKLAEPIAWIWQNQLAFILLAMLFALAAASACVYLAERLLPASWAYYVLGIKPHRPAPPDGAGPQPRPLSPAARL